MYLFKEIKDFVRFFWKTPQTDKDIVFYAESEVYFYYFEGIIKQFVNHNHKRICYITSSPEDPILSESSDKISVFYSKHLLPFLFIFIRCKVFVMSLMELNHYHLKRSIYDVHYVYVCHSFVSMHMMCPFGAFDYYDSILCVGPFQIAEFMRYGQLYHQPTQNYVEAGYFPIEQIYRKHEGLTIDLDGQDKGTVLIAPSWGAMNIVESCGEELIDILLNAGYSVILRPHPEAIRRAHSYLDTICHRFNSNHSFIFDKSAAPDESILKSQFLISDSSGIVFEFAFGAERPVVFIDVPLKIRNDKYREMDIEPLELKLRERIGVVLSPDKLGSIVGIIQALNDDLGRYRKSIIQLRKENIYHFGRSSEVGVKYILSLL